MITACVAAELSATGQPRRGRAWPGFGLRWLSGYPRGPRVVLATVRTVAKDRRRARHGRGHRERLQARPAVPRSVYAKGCVERGFGSRLASRVLEHLCRCLSAGEICVWAWRWPLELAARSSRGVRSSMGPSRSASSRHRLTHRNVRVCSAHREIELLCYRQGDASGRKAMERLCHVMGGWSRARSRRAWLGCWPRRRRCLPRCRSAPRAGCGNRSRA